MSNPTSHADWSKLFTLASAAASEPARTEHFVELLSPRMKAPMSGSSGLFDLLATELRKRLSAIRAPTREDLRDVAVDLRESSDGFARTFAVVLSRELEAESGSQRVAMRASPKASAEFFKRMISS